MNSSPAVAGAEPLILVDSSSWIHMLRTNGDPAVRARVQAALASGQACWCPLVQLELWNGARGRHEQNVLQHFAEVLPELPIDQEVWSSAFDLARRARSHGIKVPTTDLVIAACARRHGVALETADSDFELLDRVR